MQCCTIQCGGASCYARNYPFQTVLYQSAQSWRITPREPTRHSNHEDQRLSRPSFLPSPILYPTIWPGGRARRLGILCFVSAGGTCYPATKACTVVPGFQSLRTMINHHAMLIIGSRSRVMAKLPTTGHPFRVGFLPQGCRRAAMGLPSAHSALRRWYGCGEQS